MSKSADLTASPTAGKRKRKKTALSESPVDAIDSTDPGDETQRNFRYQHGYGVILLAQAAIGTLPYVALWCEQREDFLGERLDGKYDGWQIKTRAIHRGRWKLLDDDFVRSIGRFAELVSEYGEQIGDLWFASNVEMESVTAASSNDALRCNCPDLFLDHIRECDSPIDVADPFANTFESLQALTAVDADELFLVLRRVRTALGPSRGDMDAVLCQEHLAKLPGCHAFAAAQLVDLKDELVHLVGDACSLKVTDGARHVGRATSPSSNNPTLIAKRIAITDVLSAVGAGTISNFRICRAPSLAIHNKALRAGERLREKLQRGGLDSDQTEQFEVLARSAEHYLLEEAYRLPDRCLRMQTDLEAVVINEYLQAHLRAKQYGVPFGERLMIDIQDRLSSVATHRPAEVWMQPAECLVGIAALLTDDCRMWFSPRFVLSDGEPDSSDVSRDLPK